MKQSVKFILLAVGIVVLMAAAVFVYNYLSKQYQPEELAALSPGQTEAAAPDFTVQSMDGKTVKLSDYFGKPIVINFWATWCGPCETELPAFDAAYREYGDEVVFLMVNLTDGYRDTVDSVKEFVSDSGYSFPVYFDTTYSGAEAYSVYSIPLTVMIDKTGAIYQRHLGTMSEAMLNDYIEALCG